MTPDALQKFFAHELPQLTSGRPGADSGFALPESSLACLRTAVTRLGVRRVFEFGSGRSTRLFLEAGCELTSVEDDQRWLDDTARDFAPALKARWSPTVQGLETVWHRGAPFQGWRLTDDLARRLAEAELVLVDSPALPRFREHALLLALRHVRCGLVVVDDASIAAVGRFCTRLAVRNRLPHHQTTLDHGLFFVAAGSGRLDERRGLVETLKIWRFNLVGRRFLRRAMG